MNSYHTLANTDHRQRMANIDSLWLQMGRRDTITVEDLASEDMNSGFSAQFK